MLRETEQRLQGRGTPKSSGTSSFARAAVSGKPSVEFMLVFQASDVYPILN